MRNFALEVVIISTVTVSSICSAVEFNRLSTEADAIAVVEIISTDYTATAADGPMYASAKVLKVLKGEISKRKKLRFGESGWWGPTYRKGDRRIVFLGRVPSKNEYYKTKWHTIYTNSVDFFVIGDSLSNLSLETLKNFLSEIQDLSQVTPGVEISKIQKRDKTRIITIDLINDEDYPFWLNPSLFSASFEANQIHYSRRIRWNNYKEHSWVEIEPSSRIEGYFKIKEEEIKNTEGILVMMSHMSTIYPYRCWVGSVSLNVSFKE
jgi:hypothetical protein